MPRPAGVEINRDAWDDLLELTGLNTVDVAERGDIKIATLRCIVSGNDRASVPNAHKIAKGLGCRVRTLFPALNPAADQAAA